MTNFAKEKTHLPWPPLKKHLARRLELSSALQPPGAPLQRWVSTMAEDSGAILRHISSLKDMLDKVQNPRTSSDTYSSLLSLLLLGLELSDWGQCRHRTTSIGISWSPHGWMAYPGVLQASPMASYNHIRVLISDRRELHRNWLVEACGSYSMSQLVFIWELRVHTFAWVQLSWFADMFSIVVSKFFTALGSFSGCHLLLCHLSCTNFQYSDTAIRSSFLLKIWLGMLGVVS